VLSYTPQCHKPVVTGVLPLNPVWSPLIRAGFRIFERPRTIQHYAVFLPQLSASDKLQTLLLEKPLYTHSQ
jgi:hypothetical protein